MQFQWILKPEVKLVNLLVSGFWRQKKEIEFAVNISLKDLKTDYIDLYQVHWPDRPAGSFSGKLEYEHKESKKSIGIEETLDVLNNLVKNGKVRHIGISNETPWGTNQYLKFAEQKKITKIVSIQNAYNFLKFIALVRLF